MHLVESFNETLSRTGPDFFVPVPEATLIHKLDFNHLLPPL